MDQEIIDKNIQTKQQTISQESITRLAELDLILRHIYTRLKHEGYDIIEGDLKRVNKENE